MPPLHVMMEAEAPAGIYRLQRTQEWTPKSTNYCHTKKSQDMEHESIFWMGSDSMLLRYAYRKPFTAKFPDKCKSQNEFNPDRNGFWSGIRMVPRPIKGLVQGCIDGAQERPTASVLGSTPWYSRLKHMPLKHRYGECRKGLHR